MNEKCRHLRFPILAILAFCLTYSLEGNAQLVAGGYVCAPKNIGGEDTRLYFRQQDGLAENISKTATFPVVCPIIVDYWYVDDGFAYYGLLMTVRNDSDVSQDFQCALEEYDLLGVKARSLGRSVSVPAGGAGLFDYPYMTVLSEYNYASIRCILPPQGSIIQLSWY